LSEIAPNFACFSPPISFGGVAPEFLDLHYKIHPASDHVAKFHGDRPRELGDPVAREKKLEIWGRDRVGSSEISGNFLRNFSGNFRKNNGTFPE